MTQKIGLLGLVMAGCTLMVDGESNPTPINDTQTVDTSEPTTEDVIDHITAEIHDEIESIIEVSWTQSNDANVIVRYSFDDDLWVESPMTGGSIGDHQMLLLGIPYDSSVSYQLTWEQEGDWVEGEVQSIQNGSLPSTIPQVVDIVADESQLDPDANYFFTSMNADNTGNAYVVFIIDRKGRVVWAMDLPQFRLSLHPRISHDGTDLLIDFNSFWYLYDGGAQSQIRRIKIDGSEVALYDAPGLHHPFTETPDGHLVYASSHAYRTGRWTYESLVSLSPSGDTEEIFNCQEYFESIGETRECGSNTIFWDESRGVFLYSLYSVDTVLEIDPDSGEVLNSYGNLEDSWEFDPADSTFYWQHGPTILDDGNLMVSCHPEGNSSVLQIREYERDEETETLTQVWHFGEDNTVEGDTMGEAHRLGNGNTLHNYGSTSRLREINPAGDVVWDVRWNQGMIGRSTAISDLYALMP